MQQVKRKVFFFCKERAEYSLTVTVPEALTITFAGLIFLFVHQFNSIEPIWKCLC